MAYGFTATVATGKMTATQAGFVWLATTANFPTAAIDGGATSIANGGGNLRCYTDSTKTTQLPIEVVKFVTGVSPDVIVWGRSGSLGVGNTVYFERDTVATVQPPVTDTYGRNTVWQDYNRKFNISESLPEVDSSGNGDLTISGVFATTSTTHDNRITPKFDGSVSMSGVNNLFATATDDFTVSAWVRVDSALDQGLFSDKAPSGNDAMFAPRWDAPNNLRIGSILAAATGFTAGEYHQFTIVRDGTLGTVSVYQNGILNKLSIASASISGSTWYVGTGAKRFLTGVLYDHYLRSDKLQQEYIASEYANQSDPATFWTSSAWEDAGGSPITVNDTAATTKTSSNADTVLNVGAFNVLDNTSSTKTKSNSDFIQLASVVSINDSLSTSKSSSNADTVLNVGAFNILDSTATTKTKSNQDSIQFGAAVFVSDSVATSKSKSNSDSVLLVGQFFISDAAVTSKSSAGGDLVYLSSTVSISDSITTTKSKTNNDLVLFVGEFNVTDTVATTKSNSNNDNVSLVGEFVVLDSTATTKTDSNRDGVIIGEIVVSFNPETNYTQLFLSTTYTQPDLSRNYSQVFLSTNYSQ